MHIKKHDQDVMKKHNKRMVLSIIEKNGPISRAEIAKETNMSPTSISRIVEGLLETGIIEETEPVSNGVGRSSKQLQIVGDCFFAIGIYLDINSIKYGIINYKGKLIVENSINKDLRGHKPARVAEILHNIVKELIHHLGDDAVKIKGLGIGLPGIIDFQTGEIVFSPQFGWENVKFVNLIQQYFPRYTIIMDNEVKLRALGECVIDTEKLAGKTAVISLGTGVGSALIDNGQIYRGKNNSAGEIGHTTIDPGGTLCECGRRGCLQTYIAEWALIDDARKFVPDLNSIDEIMRYVKNQENWAVSLVERAANYISISVSNIACMYNPDRIILSGKLVEDYDEIRSLLKDKYNLFTWKPFKGTFTVSISSAKDTSIIIGSGTFALNLNIEENLLSK